ncbi:MAG: Ig-like domain-containing protein, partial [Coraliomargarita sp.]
MTDCSLPTKRLRLALLASFSLPSVLLAVAPDAVNDDLRTTDPVAANASLVLAESKLITNDSGDDKAVKSVTTPSSDGATVSWDGTNVTYTPGDGSSDVFLALDTGEHEDDSFTYTLEGSDGDDDTAT